MRTARKYQTRSVWMSDVSSRSNFWVWSWNLVETYLKVSRSCGENFIIFGHHLLGFSIFLPKSLCAVQHTGRVRYLLTVLSSTGFLRSCLLDVSGAVPGQVRCELLVCCFYRGLFVWAPIHFLSVALALWCPAVFLGSIHPIIWVVGITVFGLRVWRWFWDSDRRVLKEIYGSHSPPFGRRFLSFTTPCSPCLVAIYPWPAVRWR